MDRDRPAYEALLAKRLATTTDREQFIAEVREIANVWASYMDVLEFADDANVDRIKRSLRRMAEHVQKYASDL
jgi:hypothetical protein